MSALRDFARRLLVQAVVSGTVMAGLQIAVRFGPEMFPAQMPTAAVEEAAADLSQATQTAVATAAVVPASASPFAQDRTSADVKAGRFPIWRDRMAPAAAIAPQRLVSKRPDTGLSDVVLFDRCRPGCESRDPLLAFNKRPTATPSPVPATVPDRRDDIASSSGPDAAEVASFEDGRPSEGIVAGAARGGLSVARRIVDTAGCVVDTAGSVVGW